MSKEEKSILRPTVKRDISLFTVRSWQRGYTEFLLEFLGWWYNIYFHYDGIQVNFYHKKVDFDYFKNVITEKVNSDHLLFASLNGSFQNDVLQLKEYMHAEITNTSLEKIEELEARIMSFYIFVVSDAFVTAHPEAWESRTISEGILYTIDARVEDYMKATLYTKSISPELSHVLTREEYSELIATPKANIENKYKRRISGYILYNNTLEINKSFVQYCSEHSLENPEYSEKHADTHVLEGMVASKGGIIRGVVKVVRKKEDIGKVEQGDILVSIMTNVNYTPVMKYVSAIVTDEGGVTCHAAIVAREFHIPCIVGTKNATQILRDGDFIEVNTLTGSIKKLLHT